jgi:hypothetical protein
MVKEQHERHQAFSTLFYSPANGAHRKESSGERALLIEKAVV